MEGCSKYCSFCVVPYTRGEEVSRPFEDVLAEIAGLAAQGVKEITLLGQNVNAYRGTHRAAAQTPTSPLLLRLRLRDAGIERIRYTTSHPREFTQRLIDAYAKLRKLAQHVHLPVQSGSDRVLAAMKRGYTALEYKLDRAPAARGAPGHRACRPTSSSAFPARPKPTSPPRSSWSRTSASTARSVFVYSPRPGTPAADLPDDVPHEEKLERLQRLQAAARRPVAAHRRRRWSAARAARAGGRASRKRSDSRAVRPHREQPRGQLRRGRPRSVDSMADVRITAARAPFAAR